jgi:proline iminopeptidase
LVKPFNSPLSYYEKTTRHLVADIETLREFLKISSWQVFGGSWGSTLAMAYAQKHPSRVSEIVLRGIFMLRKKEIKWFYQEGASYIFPDAWESYLEPIPHDERDNLLAAYYKRLSSSDLNEALPFAKAWSIWEGRTSHLLPQEDPDKDFGAAEFALSFARIECHYFTHGGFFDTDNQLLENVDKIRHIPAVIVQGRYDVVCPMQSAWELHRAWPQAKFCIVPDAGHSAFEAGITHELVTATNSFAE